MATKKKVPKKKASPVEARKLDQWRKKGEALARAKWGNQWAIAKWMCKGEDAFKKISYTVAGARDFTFAYVSQIRAPLPPLAAKGLEIAGKFGNGTATLEEREEVANDIWNYVSERNGWQDTSHDDAIMRVMTWLVRDEPGPGERDSITELLREILGMVNKFEDHSESAAPLIGQFFSTENNPPS
jgi:hypothetical protein